MFDPKDFEELASDLYNQGERDFVDIAKKFIEKTENEFNALEVITAVDEIFTDINSKIT